LIGAKIAIIGGTGDQGFGQALRWARAGEHVIIGSRQKQKAEDAVKRLKDMLGQPVTAEGMENPAATAAATITVLSVPFAAQIDILKSIESSFKPGDILVDLTVPLATAVGGRATRTLALRQGSAAQQAAELVPRGVKVVSAFNNVSAEALQAIDRPVECDVIVCGDDEKVKETVMRLAEEIPNIHAVNGGPLENAHVVEQLTALLIGINIRYKVQCAGLRLTGLPLPPPR
jgi:NADPH-dependent F420 reductase